MTKNNSQAVAEKLFAKWNNLLQTGDKNQVAEMYSEDATFLPTLNGELKRGVQGAAEYFEHFLQKNPIGTVVEGAVQESVDGDTIIYSGLYNFEISPDETREIVQARFTFVFQKNAQGEWKIIHHHSSLRPE